MGPVRWDARPRKCGRRGSASAARAAHGRQNMQTQEELLEMATRHGHGATAPADVLGNSADCDGGVSGRELAQDMAQPK